MPRFPALDIGDLQVVPRVPGNLPDDLDDHQRAQRIGGRVFRGPVRGRVEPGTQLIGGELVTGRLETVASVPVGRTRLRIQGRPEPGAAEALSHRDGWRQRMRQIDVFCVLE